MLNKLLEKIKNLILNSNSKSIDSKKYIQSNKIKRSIIRDLENTENNSLENRLKKMGIKSLELAKREFIENNSIILPNNQIQMKKEIKYISNRIDNLEKEFDLNNACRNGCHYCCYHAIFIYSYEQISLSLPILNLDNVRKNGLFERATSAIEKIDSLGLFDYGGGKLLKSPRDYENFQKMIDKDSEIYFQNKIPCPFLLPNKLCMFYDIRPAVCWGYRVYTSEKDCAKERSLYSSFTFSDWQGYLNRKILMPEPPAQLELFPQHLLPYTVRNILVQLDKNFKRRKQ